MKLQAVEPKTLTPQILEVFGKQNALLTAGDRTSCNTMTIGWAQMGTLWAKPVCTGVPVGAGAGVDGDDLFHGAPPAFFSLV